MSSTRIILWSTSAVLAWGSLRGENSLAKYMELADSLKVLQNTVSELKSNVDTLKSEIDRIEKSPSYAEKVLRDKYHVTEENETIIFFAD